VRPALAERDRPTLLKLLQLDLEMHPPPGAVVALRIVAHPARPQTAQQGLFAAQAPEAGRMEILLARLRKLVGEERVGAPELLDTHAPEAFRVAGFAVDQASLPGVARRAPPMAAATPSPTLPASHAPALRMVRPPCAVAIELRGDAPAAMDYEGQRRPLQARSGPWRSSGAWWTNPAWCREEWDVALEEEPRRCLRLAYEPGTDGYAATGAAPARNGCWYVIGIYD
jgi:protein ImuB